MNKQLNALGMAKKSGNILTGEKRVLESMKTLKTKPIIFLASDAGENIKSKIRNKCHYYQILVVDIFDTEQLSKAIGSTNKKVVALLDPVFYLAD